MPQLEHLEAIEKRLWTAADTLRANSNYASNEYFLPVMGLIFLRHAYSRYLGVKDEIEASLPSRGGKKRPLTKEDFSEKSAIFLRPPAQFDSLVALTDSDDRARAITQAMESIEADNENLRGVLPKSEYQELENAVLGQLLRSLNPDELKTASGDVFGRIYEYFLTQFADLKAHDNGEFFTPVSLVSLIASVLEPGGGTVLDPACGSGGMFVQSAHFVERLHANPAEKLTFYGLEKNATTIRLAKMNLAVHGLEGNIQKAITYYEAEVRDLAGKKVLEILPPGVSKGAAIQEILSLPGFFGFFPIYIGDDITDESAFHILQGQGLTIKVGHPGTETAASHFLPDPEAVQHFLALLAAPLEDS